jgi:hypothetical protein
MPINNHLSRTELALRWNVSTKTVDRLRQRGILPWVDMSAGPGKRPLVRFMLADIELFEQQIRQAAGRE